MKKDILRGGIRPKAFTKEIQRQLRKGKLTEEEALALAQQYMDNLEYNEPQTATDCGGIQPEVTECTEQF